MSSPPSRPPLPAGLVLTARLVLVGGVCGALMALMSIRPPVETQITTYSAPKETVRKLPEASSTPSEPARLWGAIVPLAADLWFFKLTGPVDEVAGLEPQLREFLSSVKFDGGEPTWTTPAGWQQRPGNQFRFATLMIPGGEKPLELTVSKLSRGEGPLDEQMLANVNRWRGQVSLPPLKQEELSQETERMELAGVETTIVNCVGNAQPNTMGRPPFAGK